MIETNYTYGLQIFQNTAYAYRSLPYSAGDVQSLAEALDVYNSTGVITYLSSDISYVSTTVTGLNDPLDYKYTADGAGGVAGGIASPTLPLNVAWVVKYTTGLTGRSARGRNYIGGIPEGAVTGNALVVSTAEAIVSELVGFKDQIDAEGWTQVIVSRYFNNAKRVIGVTLPVTGVGYTDLRVDTRRSRLDN